MFANDILIHIRRKNCTDDELMRTNEDTASNIQEIHCRFSPFPHIEKRVSSEILGAG